MHLGESLVYCYLVMILNLLYGMIPRTTMLKAKLCIYSILYPNHIFLLMVSSLWTCLKTEPIKKSGLYMRQLDKLQLS